VNMAARPTSEHGCTSYHFRKLSVVVLIPWEMGIQLLCVM